MIIVKGREFTEEGAAFKASDWLAPILETPDEIQIWLDAFHLAGRTIMNIQTLGHAYNLTRDAVEDYVYTHLDQRPDEETKLSDYASIPDDFPFLRLIETDEPLMIQFEDGDTFEIDAPQEPEFRMSMNELPWGILPGINDRNCDAKVVFGPCIGQKITAAKVNTYLATNHPMYGRPYNEDGTPKCIASSVVLELENGYCIQVKPWFDYADYECMTVDGKEAYMPFKDLKYGLHNWEDLHDDDTINFHAASYMLYCSDNIDDICKRVAENGIILTLPESKKPLFIPRSRFAVMEWALVYVLHEPLQGQDYIHLSKTVWEEVLCAAEHFLTSRTFDEIFDLVLQEKANLDSINRMGKQVWVNRRDYLTLVRDLIRWSELVLDNRSILEIDIR